MVVKVVVKVVVTARRGGRSASPLALGSLLFACASVLFAAAGVDGATLWRSSEAPDYGLVVYLAGYTAVAAAAAIQLAAGARKHPRAGGQGSHLPR